MSRYNCNLGRVIKAREVNKMINWCRAFGWRYFWIDTLGITDKREPIRDGEDRLAPPRLFWQRWFNIREEEHDAGR